MANLLVLEDDAKMATELRLFLNNRGFNCDVVYDGVVFFKQLHIATYDLYILDVNVPLMNGIEVCKKVRETNADIPVLMLTAFSAVEDKVNAFESGADDYLVKPFHLDELLVRVNALLRRSQNRRETDHRRVTIDDLVVDLQDMKVTRSGREIILTPKEYKLLELLVLAGGKPVSKQTIASKVWDINFETGTNTIEVYINYLRNKIDKGFDRALVQTRPGFGYYIK